MSGLSRARRHFEGGLAARAERLRQLTEDCVGPAATEVAEALVREIYAVRTSARVFKIRPLEQEAQAVAERLEREIERGAGGSTESRDSVLEFLAGLAGYGNAQAARESGPRLSAPPLLRESQEVVYRTDADAMVKNYLSVLVVGHSDLPSQVRNALPGQRFEVITCSDWQTALRIAENQRPDVIIAERALGAENTTVMWGRLARLGLPWVEVIPEMREGVERRRWPQIAPPFGTDEVLHAIEKATGLLAQDDGKMGRLGNLTLEGVTARLVREIERGLLEATDAGHDVQVPMDGGTEVLAAAWSAVAQVRALVSRRSGGRVQFRDPPSVIGTSLLAMGGVGDPGGKHEAVDLVGRRIVIADDDRAVRWFFTRLLQGAGAQVVPAADGREALAVSRALRPDLIISDILMPELDGLALCRQVRRDPTLWDIPVVLLSWKDDFIQQMRDLEAGAQDYLRKEEEEGQLLRRISATLEPRREIERRLRSTGDVRGRLEPIGVGVLLRTVGAERQQADVELRSYEHRIDVRIRQGNVAEVIVDMRDGMRVVGAPAIRALAGIRGGRFWVTGATQSPEASPGMRGRFALAEAQGELFGMLEACQGERVAAIQEVSLEPVFLGLGGEACSRLEVQLMEGGTPLDAVADGTLSADEVALLLEELVLRGACIRLRGAEGQDLGAEHLLGRRGDEGVRREEGRTMREVKPRPGTLLQWGRDGAEARTFAEFELAEAKVRQELNSTSVEPDAQSPEMDDASAVEDLSSWVSEEMPEGATEPMLVREDPDLSSVDSMAVGLNDEANDAPENDVEEPEVASEQEYVARFSTAGWILVVVLLCALGFLGHKLWPQDEVEAPIMEAPQVTDALQEEPLPVLPDASLAIPSVLDAALAPVDQQIIEEQADALGQLWYPVVSDLELAADEGLLRIVGEPRADGEATLLLGDRALAAPPVEAAVRDGIYALWLRYRVAGETRVSVRYIRVVAQHSRVVTLNELEELASSD